MRVPSGSTTTYLYFVAVDATDRLTREPTLSSFTVHRSRNGAADAAMTSPTVVEIDASTMPGVYALLLDEDTTIDAGHDEQEMVLHITHAGMAPVTRSVTLYRRAVTSGRTLSVEADGDLVKVNTLDGHTPQSGDAFARLGDPAGASVSAAVAAVTGQTAAIEIDTQDIQGRLPAALIGGRMDSNVQATAATLAFNLTGNITGDLSGSVGSVTGAVGSVTGHTPQTGDVFAALPANFGGLVVNENGRVTAQSVIGSVQVGTFPSGARGEVRGEVASALATYDGPPHAEMTAALAALEAHGDVAWVTSALDAEDVRAQVVGALAVDATVEPTAPPTATAPIAAKVGWIFAAARNRGVQTPTAQTLYAADGTTPIGTAACSIDADEVDRGAYT